MRNRLKDYRLEKMKKAMNLTNYKNFLNINVDEQGEWPSIVQQRMDEQARDLDDKIREVNAKKEQLAEAQRQRFTEFSKRWDVFK